LTLSFLFRASLYLLVISSHFSLILTPEIHILHAVLLFLILVSAWFYSGAQHKVPRLFFNTILVLILVGCITYGFFWAEYFFKAGIYFLAYVLALRMFNVETARDVWLVYILSFFELCAASVLTISIKFLLGLFLYLAMAGFSLMLFNLKREMERVSARERPDTARSLRRSFLALCAGTAAAVFIIGFLLFFFIPRIGTGFISLHTRTHPRVTAFSDSVSLGEIGPVSKNYSVVMRVRIQGEDKPRPYPIYWRGAALDYYDGITWTDLQDIAEMKWHRYGAVFKVSDMMSFKGQDTAEIYLEPTDSLVLFAPEGVEAFYLPRQFRRMVIYNNDYYALAKGIILYDRIKYLAYFRTPDRDPGRLSRAYEGVDRDRLQEEMFDYLIYQPELEPVCELTRSEIDPELPPYRQALMVKEFLENNYIYTESPPATLSDNPLSEFIFETRRGYCEHFATAMAMMLRCLGVPTRLVTGFLEGDWNKYEKYYLVRQSHAHAWVEVYFPGQGWVRFDASPMADEKQSGGLVSMLDEIMDSIYFRWYRWVIEYSIWDQMRGLKLIQSRGFHMRREFMVFGETLRYHVTRILHQPKVAAALLILIESPEYMLNPRACF
jgi:hypothetical protein